MKRKSNLYKNIYDLTNILFCFEEVCRNTKNKKKVEEYRELKCAYVFNIYDTLKRKKYEIGKYHIFTIYEPKERKIVSQNIEDKIVNHLVARFILYPALMPLLIDSNVASRRNMGVRKGLELSINKCNTKKLDK